LQEVLKSLLERTDKLSLKLNLFLNLEYLIFNQLNLLRVNDGKLFLHLEFGIDPHQLNKFDLVSFSFLLIFLDYLLQNLINGLFLVLCSIVHKNEESCIFESSMVLVVLPDRSLISHVSFEDRSSYVIHEQLVISDLLCLGDHFLNLCADTRFVLSLPKLDHFVRVQLQNFHVRETSNTDLNWDPQEE
jgi:hypothetical protein